VKVFYLGEEEIKVKVLVCAVLCDVLKVLRLRPFVLPSCGISVEILGEKPVPLSL